MKKQMSLVLSLVILFSIPSALLAAGNKNVKTARQVIELLNKGEYKSIISRFDSAMTKAAPEPRLKAIWNTLTGETGKLQKELGNTVSHYDSYEIVVVTCRFEKMDMDVKLVFDKNDRIAGLFFSRAKKSDDQSGISSESRGKSKPYISKDVTFTNKKAGVTLAGTLTLPKSGGKVPAVLLISGSGPNTRNETVAGHKIFEVIADYLTRHGIAVLRYDKRGVGKSTGNYAAATMKDFASDALAGFNFLRSVKRVNPDEVGLIGHSEGGEIAPIVADRSHHVAFIVMMAGPGVKGYRIILTQIALIDRTTGVGQKSIDSSLALERELLRIVMTEKDSVKAAADLTSILEKRNHEPAAAAKISVGDLLSPWYREFISYNPVPALEKVKCPVLALWGSKDLQVPPSESLPAVRNALRRGGNKNFKVMELKGLNHLFQEAKTGSPLEYGMIKEAISPRALEIVTNWILKETARKG